MTETTEMARLERVLGCTACTRSLAVDPHSGLVAYPAGSALVLANPRSQCRTQLLSPGKCQLTCLAWSPCGQFIATGEFGMDPQVRVWALRQSSGGGKAEPECELGWHKLGISCVSFSPDSELLISVGNNHDKQVLVWDWRKRRRLAESRLTCQVNAMAQAESGRMFVTVGVRHVKFWYLERSGPAAAAETGQQLLLQGRSAILADQRNNTFIACCCVPGGQRTFALTQSRLLVEFVDKRLVNLFQMGAEVPFSLALGPGLLFIGFGDGTIRALGLEGMEMLLEFGKPLALHVDPAEGGCSERFPDVHSLAFHAPSGVLTALYSDRSLFHWLLQPTSAESQRIPPPVRLSSQLSHVGPIFELEAGIVLGNGNAFLTAGADETVRLWSLSADAQPLGQSPTGLSPELRKILFLSPETNSLTERPDKNFGGIMADTLESTTGVRCIRLSAGAEHLACGRKNGNICVFDVSSRGWPLLAEFEAHEGEVLCLDYHQQQQSHWLLASGSRDRFIHLFDANTKYAHLLAMDEHEGPVVTIKFLPSNDGLTDLPLLASIDSNQVLITRQLFDGNGISAQPKVRVQCPQGAACIAALPRGAILLMGCQDGRLREFNAASGQLVRTIGGDLPEGIEESSGRITRVCVDPSGSVAALLSADRSVQLRDLDGNGRCLAVLGLPSDCVTAMAFSADCKRLLLVTYSGCIAVWRLSAQLQRRMVAKLAAPLDNSNRCVSPDRLESPGGSAGDSLLDQQQFGSLASLDHLQVLPASQSLSAPLICVKRASREGDDELDSGIGGGGGANSSGQETHQRFELKRLHPSEQQLNNQQQPQQGEGGEDEVPDMLSPAPSPMGRPQRPPPYGQHLLGRHQGQAAPQQSSRSMSNLHSVNGGQQTPRRRWNQAQTTVPPNNSINGFVGQGPTMPPVIAANHFGNGQQPAQPQSFATLGIPHEQQQQQRFGISNSVSLSAIRAKLADAEIPQPPPPQPATAWPARNSLTRRFLKTNGHAGAEQPMWTPAAKGLAGRRRTSNLFNPCAETASVHQQLGGSPGGSSQASTPSGIGIGTNDVLRHSPEGSSAGGRRLFQSAAAHQSAEGSGARMAMSRIKQRRQADGTPSVMSASSVGPLRSRSQSPSQLAMAMLASVSGGSTAGAQQHYPRAKGGVSPSGRSAISSTSTPSSCQPRLSSVGSSRLQQARQRLKKSQENLATLQQDDPPMFGEERPADGALLARSRSIGNLRLSRPIDDNSAALSDALNHRQMAKSVTDLVAEQKRTLDGDDNGLGEGRLAECRQRLAQSIRDIRRISEPELLENAVGSHQQAAGEPGPSLDSSWLTPGGTRAPRRGVQKKLDRQWPLGRGQTDLIGAEGNSPQSAANPLFFQSAAPPQRSLTGLRSASSLVAASRSPRSNYLAHKLAGRGTLDIAGNQQEHMGKGRSLSAELGLASAGLANANSPDSKRLAMHAQECLREMQQACDKLLGARQLIKLDPSISQEEKLLLLANVNRAVAAFSQRLAMDDAGNRD